MLIQNNEKKLVFLLFLFSLVIRLIILSISDNDDTSFIAAHALMKGWSIIKSAENEVPPLGAYLIKISLLFPKTPLSVIMPNLILGSLLIIPFYYLAKLVYSQQVAFFSTIALGVFYKYINVSVISCAEISFCFLVFTALYLFFKFKQTEKKMLFLILSGLSLTLATMARYEGWPLIPILCAFLIKEKKKHLFTFFSVSMIFPLLWMYLNYRVRGNPMGFYFWIMEVFKYSIPVDMKPPNLFQAAANWFSRYQYIFPPLILWLGILGLFWSIFKRKFVLPIIFLTFFSLLVFVALYCHSGSCYDPRYAVPSNLFFLIFIIYGVSIIPKVGNIALCCLVLYLSVTWIQRAIDERPLLPPVQKEIVSYLKNNLQKNERLALLGGDYLTLIYNLTFISSNLDNLLVRSTIPEGTSQKVEDYKYEMDDKYLQEYARHNKPGYFMVSNYRFAPFVLTNIEDILKFFPDAKAECVFNTADRVLNKNIENYTARIYKMTYKPE